MDILIKRRHNWVDDAFSVIGHLQFKKKQGALLGYKKQLVKYVNSAVTGRFQLV